jgi:drug/metabolite transporter (DMT)-like permease
MDPLVFGAVLAAAAMHAGWNAVIKTGLDRMSSMLLLALVQSGIAVILLPFVPLPLPQSWAFIAGSALLHAGYKLLLVRAYGAGDLSQIYPLARGCAPLMVALAGIAALGEPLTPPALAAAGAIALGAAIMSLRGGIGLAALPPAAITYALATAGFTAAYTLADGIGARLAGTATGFALWMFAGDGLIMLAAALVTGGPSAFRRIAPAWRSGLIAGALSLASYCIAIWAMTRAPIALVAALRETSVLFAMLIAVAILREPAGPARWIAAGLIGGGLVLVRI